MRRPNPTLKRLRMRDAKAIRKVTGLPMSKTLIMSRALLRGEKVYGFENKPGFEKLITHDRRCMDPDCNCKDFYIITGPKGSIEIPVWGGGWKPVERENPSSISRHCPNCLPDDGVTIRFEYHSTEKSKDGKTITNYRCGNCGLEHKVTKRGPTKRGAPSQIKATQRLQEMVDDEKFDIEKLADRKGNDVWLSIRPKKYYENRGLARIGPRGSLELSVTSFGSSEDIKSKGKDAWRSLDSRFGIFEPSQQEDFDALIAAIRRLSKAAGTDSPKKQATLEDVEKQFPDLSYPGKNKYIRELTSAITKSGKHTVVRNKRKRLVIKRRNPAPKGSLAKLDHELSSFHAKSRKGKRKTKRKIRRNPRSKKKKALPKKRKCGICGRRGHNRRTCR